MNCDQVFNVLTRGPFPTGEPIDDQVEAHLACCPECWQFAEALRPAVDVFQEAVHPAEGRDLPGYWGDRRPAAEIVADLARRTTQTAVVPSRTIAARRYRPRFESQSSGSIRDVLTVIGFLSILTLAAVGVAWLLRLW